MVKKKLFFVLSALAVAIVVLTGSVNAITNVSACGSLGTANTYYALNTSITNAGTCFTINADNITLDCGYYGRYNLTGTGSGYGIDASGIYSEPRYNTTIKNCSITNFNTGIYSYSSTWGQYLYNHVYGNAGNGISFGRTHNSTIAYNNVTDHHVVGSNSDLFLTICSDNNITNNDLSYSGNNIYLTGEGTASYRNLIAFNNISYHTAGGHGGIYVAYGSSNNTISNNYFYNNTNKAISISSGADYTVFANNIVTHAGAAMAVYVIQVNYTTLVNNTINCSNAQTSIYNVLADHTVIANNTIAANGSGILLDTSFNATCSGNNVTVPRNKTGLGFSTYGSTRWEFQQDINSTNIVNGLPVKYYDGVYAPCPNNTVLNFGSAYSFIGFAGCNNVTLNGTTTTQRIGVFYSTNMTVSNSNSSYNSGGVLSFYSSGSSFINNTFSNSAADGFYGIGNANNTFINNTISNNGRDGILFIISSPNVTAINNTFVGNVRHGINLYDASNCFLANNTATNNGGNGISLDTLSNCSVTGNNVSTNVASAKGIYVSGVTNATISNNTVSTSNSGTSYALHVASSSAVVVNDSVFSASSAGVADVYVEGTGTSNLTNVTFNRADTAFAGGATGGINVFWYVDGHVIDNNGLNLAGANVNASNVNGTSIFNATANATGWIARQTVLEYWRNTTGFYSATPHWFNASLDGYGVNYSQSSVTATGVVTRALFAREVNLVSPADGSSSSSYAQSLCFAPNSTRALANASLLVSGVVVATNSSALVNASSNCVNYSFAGAGVYSWSIAVYDSAGWVGSVARVLTIIESVGGGSTPTPTPAPSPSATPQPSASPTTTAVPTVIPTVESAAEPNVVANIGSSPAGFEPLLSPDERNNVEGVREVSESKGNVSALNSSVCHTGESTDLIVRRTIELIQTPNGVLTRVTLRVSNEGNATAFGVSVSEFVDTFAQGERVEYSSLPQDFFEGVAEWVIDVLPAGAQREFSYGVFRRATQAELAGARAPVVSVRSVKTVSAKLDYSLWYAALSALVLAGGAAAYWFYSRKLRLKRKS